MGYTGCTRTRSPKRDGGVHKFLSIAVPCSYVYKVCRKPWSTWGSKNVHHTPRRMDTRCGFIERRLLSGLTRAVCGGVRVTIIIALA